MRIGIDIRVADPRGSGQQRYLWRLGGYAATGGHEVRYLTVRRQPEAVTLPDGTELHRLHALSRRRLRESVRALGLDVLLLNPERSPRYRGLHPNVLRAAYGTDHYRQKLRSFRHPLVRAARVVWREAPWTRLERSWERAYYEGAAKPPEVLAQSRYMRDEILSSYDVPPDRVHVVPNGVDPSEFNPDARTGLRVEARRRWSIADDAVCFLLLGHNYRLKGLRQAVEALSLLRERGSAHLLVAGRATNGAQRRAAERLVRSAGVDARVTLAGEVQPSLSALAAADALVHLSWHDSFGFAVLEAMASGLPVITTPYAGAAEVVEAGVSGLIVDPADRAATLTAMTRLLDTTARTAMGSAAAAAAARLDEAGSFDGVLRVMELAARGAREGTAGRILGESPPPQAPMADDSARREETR